ncbi:hypothetical protein BEI02_16235 [Elizabethkingia sp. HvH-WGS333]|uniref:Putative Co/Zn/Cd efflux system membrane fusion protein n=2 Tax=Elizabethkingia anophelis TaxID=1117645 RepID=A0A455ZGJ5_9FLAO|nr:MULTISPECIES: DUF3347 domain-containing protein [Elizabethkingia]AIL45299.1 putative Co/Zn/Cd efflux system membrane fusion protein [Elizabethkingia anophelis NUHP1]MCL1641491.1 DUF3347 domain-containing protein [Elizabethkingia anophelis]MCL1646302.1 DUF3347 domain-containing protein [Elizabethkingia anophelis]OIK45882.1 hypothetical protein BEI02_16235 [Elizabethkingia sp. HvH-WGS333]DAC75893.1 TPA_exp: putative Co/Zn/Cd efflux system membrane fusion protein [Elizabethkingia anophelis]
MKHLILGIAATSVLALTACNNNSEKKSEKAEQVPASKIDSTVTNANAAETKQADFTELYSHYQHMATALSNDDDKETGAAAKGMLESLAKIETGGMKQEEKKSYDDIAADVKENAEHIADNIGNIAHQREHFAILSKDFYDITKTFGTQKPLYKVKCPMYNNNKGAIWLSSTKEVKNPYLGKAMSTCGEVQEELK